jgi:hypothetical protein
MRKHAVVLTAAIAALLLVPGAAPAATLTPTITIDEDSVLAPGPGGDTGCSLREAITAANTDGSYGGCVAVGASVNEGPDTIMLANGAVYERALLGSDEDMNATGDLDIRDDDAGQVEDVTFQTGPDGATIKGGGTAPGDRVLDVASAVTVTLSRVEITSGHAPGTGSGGGVRNLNGTLNLSDSFVYLNSAATTGGGIENGATTNVTNSTITGNFAGANGGGLDSGLGAATLKSVTVAFNEADSSGPAGGDGGGISMLFGTVTLTNTIVANNHNGPYPWTAPDCEGTPTSLGYNLIGDTTGCSWTSTTGDITGVTFPGLGVHGENGGPTQTVPLTAGSPAIDAANPAAPGSGGNACPATDQRGVGRPLGPRCDIGAFEATLTGGPTAVLPPPATTPKPKKCKKKKQRRGADVAKKKKCKKKKKKRSL